MGLTFPRDLVLEAYLGGWVDITVLAQNQSLRQVEPVVINRGVPNERGQSLAPPQTLECALNNAGGTWTPGNPMSPYYAYLQGRNVPVRLSLRTTRDTFTRTAPSDWGFTDTQDGYATFGVNTTFSVAAGVGTMSVSAVASFGVAYVGNTALDSEVAASCGVLPFVTPTGAAVEPCNLVLRYQPSGPQAGEYYFVRLEIRTDNTVWITIHNSVTGQLATPVNLFALIGLAHSGSNQLRVRFQAEGQTLRAKAWDTVNPEPLVWPVTVHDDRLMLSGFAGVRSGVAAGNTNAKPILFTYDDLEIRLPRAAGEIQKLAPRWDPSHRVKTAALTVAGVSMRLGRPSAPVLPTAGDTFTRANPPKTWWPLNDPSTSVAGAAAIGSGSVKIINTDLTQAEHWGQGDLGPAIGKRLKVTWHLDHQTVWVPFVVVGTVNDPAPVTSWAFETVVSFGTKTRVRFDFQPNVGASYVGYLVLNLVPTSGSSFVGYNDAGGTTTAFTTPASTWNGQPHHLRLEVVQTGGNLPFTFWVDGSMVASGPGTGSTIQTFSMWSATSPSATNSPFSMGNAALWINGAQPGAFAAAQAALGYPGERALNRAIRLCAEQAVSLDYRSDPADSATMGVQTPRKFLELLQECADVDGWLIHEPRSVAGLAVRTRLSAAARPAASTLNYSLAQVAPPLAPSADDRPTANQVTATRLNGGILVLNQPSGPMNTKDPGTDADAVGVAPAAITANVEGDVQLGNVAGWVRALGTVPDVRYPRVTVNLRAPEITGASYVLTAAALGLNVGDRLVVQSLQAADLYRDLDQVVRGLTETFRSVREHQLTFNTAPYEKYRTGVYNDAAALFDSGGVTTLDLALTTSTTGARNVTVVSGSPWTTTASAFPIDVDIEGERVSILTITGTGPAQAMTILTRSVNGVVKAHAAGAVVRLWQPSYFG